MAVQDQSIGSLLKGAVTDAQDLIRSELALAKAELRQEITRLQVSVAAFAGAAVAGILGALLLLMTIAWAIAEGLGWPVWAGLGVVTLITLVVAIGLAFVGRRRLASVQPMPLTVESFKENAKWIRARTS